MTPTEVRALDFLTFVVFEAYMNKAIEVRSRPS